MNLLVVQPTPFCNINCDYCYLPNRDSTKRMPVSTLVRAVEQVLAGGMVGERLSIVWHAGEPLVLPVSYYEEAFRALAALPAARGKRIAHSIQTNGTLINDAWCQLIKEHSINVGLSIDGPDFIHDAHRKTRRGLGTHRQAMRGVEALRKNGISFHAIAVITEQSLDHADEIFAFFLEHDIRQVGFNIEEVEGANRSSTLAKESAERKLRDFLGRMYWLQKSSNGAVKIREFDRAYEAIARSAAPAEGNDQSEPFGIVSVDCDGNLSTFSPELLGVSSETYGDFCFGNVLAGDLARVPKNRKFKRVLRDIRAGVRLCAETCEYFALCGGGAPSNKYFENGSFASAETMYCRHTIQAPIDIVLADLEASLGVNRRDAEAARGRETADSLVA
ncbi:MAG TPA: cyclophane-forming radical SAM/SPASM peptide maturase GrrM/OscB [Pyrinomonadaceae bacterium]|nr:cyclophane-forming radical SAM/SPASM peptide maturase GrrM/OscB [Pyrinomonadaceae bacterium]